MMTDLERDAVSKEQAAFPKGLAAEMLIEMRRMLGRR